MYNLLELIHRACFSVMLICPFAGLFPDANLDSGRPLIYWIWWVNQDSNLNVFLFQFIT